MDDPFLVIHLGHVAAFALLLWDASKGTAKHISPQLCFGRAIAFALTVFDLPYDPVAWQRRFFVFLVGMLLIACASWKIYLQSDLQGEDDVLIVASSRLITKLLPFIAGVLLTLLVFLSVCHFSPGEAYRYILYEPRAPVCTLVNFLNVTSLVPQLVVSHRMERVSPAAMRFFTVAGFTHLYELAADAFVSVEHYREGSFTIHELSFMSGDFLSAIFLLDFLFMLCSHGRGLSDGFELPHNRGAQKVHEPLDVIVMVEALWDVLGRFSFGDPAQLLNHTSHAFGDARSDLRKPKLLKKADEYSV